MEDPFVTAIWSQDQSGAVKDEDEPLPACDLELHSSGEAMLQGSSLWEQSIHNLRYGLSAPKKPEEFMAYQGPAQYRKENDPAMTVRYHSYQQERYRAEYVQQKFEEKQAELERRRRQAGQVEIERQTSAAILARSRQNAMLLAQQQGQLQQQQAIFNRHYPQYSLLEPIETGSRGLGASVPATHFAHQNLPQNAVTARTPNQTSPVRLAQLLDRTITNSPTYRSSPALTYLTPTRNSPSKAARVQAPVNSTFTGLDGYDFPVPRPSGIIKQPQPVSKHNVHTGPEARTPASSADSLDPDSDLIEMRRRTRRQTTSIMVANNNAEPTPPLSADSEDDEDVLSNNLKIEKPSDQDEGSASSTLSEMIGDETPSEDDDDDNGDEDFDPRKRGARLKVPKHQEVRRIGMKKRWSSGRTRR